MKGLILSGGKGTRLRPITHTSAKQLVPVANKPVLFYGIEALRDCGILDIGIVVGETHKEIRAAVGDGSRWGMKVTYIEQAEPLGLAHAVKISRDYLQNDPFVMYLGDNLVINGIRELVSTFTTRGPNAQILLAKVPNPNQFGVAELGADGRILRLEEKPASPKSDLALVGVYMFDTNVHTAVRSIEPSRRGELEITDAIQWLIDHGHRVDPTIVTGWWKDTGKLEDMLEANRMILDRLEPSVDGVVDESSEIQFRVVIESGAQILNSRIQGPAIIGRNSVIKNSYVGPFTSVHHDCRIENAEIEHSIVLEESTIQFIDQRIADSLVGRGVTIGRTERKPRVLRFMLGDHSVVGVL